MLWVYINRYLVDKKYYMRSWREQSKALSFLSHWLDLTLPNMISKFEQEFILGETQSTISIPCGNFKRNLLQILTIINKESDIYDWSVSSNSPELVAQIMEDHAEIIQKSKFTHIKKIYLQQEFYGVSVHFIHILNVFCACKGFDLLFLVLQSQQQGQFRRGIVPGPKSGAQKQSFSYKPPFQMFVRVTEILNQVREFLEPSFLNELTNQLKSITEEYVSTFIDEDTIRSLSKQEIEEFIVGLEKLLSF